MEYWSNGVLKLMNLPAYSRGIDRSLIFCPGSSVWTEQRFPKPFVGGSNPLRGTEIF